MAGRRTNKVIIQAEGRDKGKIFVLTELSASKAERWGMKALFLLVKAGVNVPDSVVGSGMAGIAAVGIGRLFQLNFEEVEPLMDEMFECIQIQPSTAKPDIIRPLIEDDIEEVYTRVHLRAEVLQLHTGFSVADLLSKWVPKTQAAPGSNNIQTSPGVSGQSLAPNSQPSTS
jgi:hypothetical protein